MSTSRPPQTPTRSPRRAYRPSASQSSSLTPSTSRALAAASLPTRAFANDPDLRARLQTGKNALIAAERLLVSSKADKRRAHDANLAQLQDEGRKLDRERAQLEQQARSIQAQLDTERKEVEQAQRTIKGLDSRQTSIKNQLASLHADEAELKEEVLAKQKATAAQREHLARQVALNAIELSFLSEQLGLTIKSKAYDRVLFTFTRIDPSAPKRSYSFEIDVSKPTYSVPACTPALASLDELVNRLNESRDFTAFVIAIRKGFVGTLGGR